LQQNGDETELGDASSRSGKRHLFFITGGKLRKQFDWRSSKKPGRAVLRGQSGIPLMALEKPGEIAATTRLVPITASGVQGEKPLVDRIT